MSDQNERRKASKAHFVPLGKGIEHKVSLCAFGLAILCSVGGLVLLMMGIGREEGALLIGAGIGAIVQGVVLLVVLLALAEIIRLLKQLAGIEYTGTISGFKSGKHLQCSNCAALVSETASECHNCDCIF